MLVLSRKLGERIHIGGGVVVAVVGIRGEQVRLGIDAPPEVAVHREELLRRAGDEAGSPTSQGGALEAAGRVEEAQRRGKVPLKRLGARGRS